MNIFIKCLNCLVLSLEEKQLSLLLLLFLLVKKTAKSTKSNTCYHIQALMATERIVDKPTSSCCHVSSFMVASSLDSATVSRGVKKYVEITAKSATMPQAIYTVIMPKAS